jgi:hypothetical protein
MNTKFRIFRTVLLSATLTLSFLSCSESANGTDEAEVTPSSSSVVAPPQGGQGFEVNAQVYWQDGTPFTGDVTVRSEKEYGEGSLVVGQVVGGKFTLTLPSAAEMDLQIAMADEDITVAGEIAEICEEIGVSNCLAVSSQTAKQIELDDSYVFNDSYDDGIDFAYTAGSQEAGLLRYIYFTEAVRVSGTIQVRSQTLSYDMNAQAGWNRILIYGYAGTLTATTDLSKMESLGLKWTIERLPQQVAPSSSSGEVVAGTIDTLYLTKLSATDSTMLVLNGNIVASAGSNITGITVEVYGEADYTGALTIWTEQILLPLPSVNLNSVTVNAGLLCAPQELPSQVNVTVSVEASFTTGENAKRETQLAVNCPVMEAPVPLETQTLTFGADGFIDLDANQTFTKDLTLEQAKTVDLVYGVAATGDVSADKLYSATGALNLDGIPDVFFADFGEHYVPSTIQLFNAALQPTLVSFLATATTTNDLNAFFDAIGGDVSLISDQVDAVDLSAVSETSPVAFMVYITEEDERGGSLKAKFVVVENTDKTQYTVTIKSIGTEGL